MPNETTVTAALTTRKGLVSVSSGTLVKSLDMAGDDVMQATVDVSTSASQITFGAISGAPAYVLILNTHATNWIELALDSGMTQKFAKVLAGQFVLWPPSGSALFARANTGTVKLLVVACEA